MSTMPKGMPRFARQLAADQLAGPGDLEHGALDDLGELGQVAVAVLLDHAAHHARAADADIERDVRLADAVVGAGHEGVVLGRVDEDDELGAADGVGRARARSPCSIGPSRLTASRLSPACVEPTFRKAQTRSVPDSTSGSASISTASRAGQPLLHQRAEAADEVDAGIAAARSRVCAMRQVLLRASRASP